jgi:UDPglucose 6-dehydrogenase
MAAGAAHVKVCVVGLWHLGTVTAACVAAAGHDVVGLEFDPAVVADLNRGVPPLFEPGLADLLQRGLANGILRFTGDPQDAVHDADVVWIAGDTPLDDHDRANVDTIIDAAIRTLPFVRDRALVLVSSQIPVGTTARLEQIVRSDSSARTVLFACAPENLQLGRAIDAFMKPDRIVVGVRSGEARDVVTALFAAFNPRIEWMSIESAEMTKHALNAFLATSIAFVNEIAVLSERVGADARDVERGLKTDSRIGAKAYLTPGAAFAGGTLARDLLCLTHLGEQVGVRSPLLCAVRASNDSHGDWTQRRLEELLGDVSGATVGIWGLTYKPGTDSLRRSPAIALCDWLLARGAMVRAHDPAVRRLSAAYSTRVLLVPDAPTAAQGASALVVVTPWPEYRQVPARDVTVRMMRRLVVDPNGFTRDTLGADASIEYVSVGTAIR